jgi:hypothetical protein
MTALPPIVLEESILRPFQPDYGHLLTGWQNQN